MNDWGLFTPFLFSSCLLCNRQVFLTRKQLSLTNIADDEEEEINKDDNDDGGELSTDKYCYKKHLISHIWLISGRHVMISSMTPVFHRDPKEGYSRKMTA